MDIAASGSPCLTGLLSDTLERWSSYDVTILVEKPAAVNQEQHDRLRALAESPERRSRIWVAMEYRFIPNVAKLLSLLPEVGDIKMVTIRENRYPFLHKIGGWNRDREKTGDTLVEKCCHFFDLFRLITGKEVDLPNIRAIAQRGINYEEEPELYETPIIDAAYVFMPFQDEETSTGKKRSKTMGCLEVCMYAEGSRHQEEIIVTGSKGRIEATSPENKVHFFKRPSGDGWKDRSEPPPVSSIEKTVYDCSNLKEVFDIENYVLPTHGGYHYGSTAVEWFKLISAIRTFQSTGIWSPSVSLNDGLRAVEIGLQATKAIVNEQS